MTGYLVPVTEAAVRLHRHPMTLRRDLRDGVLPGTKIGGRWYITAADLDRITGATHDDGDADD